MNVLGLRHPFFLPRGRRIATVAAVIGWAVFEAATGQPFWAVLFGALGAYAAWEFFVAFDPANYRGDRR